MSIFSKYSQFSPFAMLVPLKLMDGMEIHVLHQDFVLVCSYQNLVGQV
jgi:hypothetical protein